MSRPHFFPEGSEVVGKDEKVLWEGRPLVRVLARRLFHIRVVMGYFAILAAWNLASAHADGFRANAALMSTLWLVMPALIGAAVIYGMAWVLVLTTHYTITDKRVIMQIGVAVPIALTLPLKSIVSADVRVDADGSGDIPMTTGEQKLAYLLVWPHARQWQFKAAQPMLRAIPDVRTAANILSQALVNAVPTGEAIKVEPARQPEPRTEPGIPAAA